MAVTAAISHILSSSELYAVTLTIRFFPTGIFSIVTFPLPFEMEEDFSVISEKSELNTLTATDLIEETSNALELLAVFTVMLLLWNHTQPHSAFE